MNIPTIAANPIPSSLMTFTRLANLLNIEIPFKFKKSLKERLNVLEIPYEEDKIEGLWQYMNFLIKENKKYNLTGIKEPVSIIDKHFIDSLMVFSKIKFQISISKFQYVGFM